MPQQRTGRWRRHNPSTRAYFVREGLELCLLITGLAIADWVAQVPMWIWMALPIGKAVTSILFYVLFLNRTLKQRPRSELASWIGRTARTLTPLNPDGQIRIGGEIWLARSYTGGEIPAQRDVIIREAQGNTLLVEAKTSPEENADRD